MSILSIILHRVVESAINRALDCRNGLTPPRRWMAMEAFRFLTPVNLFAALCDQPMKVCSATDGRLLLVERDANGHRSDTRICNQSRFTALLCGKRRRNAHIYVKPAVPIAYSTRVFSGSRADVKVIEELNSEPAEAFRAH